MSYILDALRKSDQQRQRGVTPTLLTAQPTATGAKRPRFLLNSVLAAVLICIGVVVGWLRPWQMKQPAPAAVPIASMPLASSPAAAVPAPPSVSLDMTGQSEHEPLTNQSIPATPPSHLPVEATTKQDSPVLDENVSAPPLSQADASVRQARNTQLPVKTAPAGTAPDEGKRIMALNELPPSIQREIPDISISFHAYSNNPKERRVMINGDMVEQGELLAPGLSLEQITPDGVILDYKGFRFKQGVR
jgi:general secretion pathway protein B